MKRSLLSPFAILYGWSFCCNAFVQHQAPKRTESVMSLMAGATPNSNTLTDYMAKSHEEKLRAVKEAEERKNAEIQALKQEIDRLKQSSSAITITTTKPMEGSIEELHAKLVAYQQFMSKYIVKAQEEKIAAVKAAEAATAKKYKDLLLPAGASTSSAIIEPTVSTATENQLYMDRNVKVSQAGSKSRWGELEVQRAVSQVGGSVNGAVVDVPPEVKEADHGLRADGGVGGPSLAERVAMGAAANSASSAPTRAVPATPSTPVAQSAPVPRDTPVSRNQILYHERNEMVSAAAKAGKGRWGPLEVEKATQLAALPIAPSSTPTVAAVSVSPQVAAADHGLRSNGGVGGPSLAERVNMGAQLEKASANADATVSPLYQQRNAMVSAAAKAGKSRWGPMEAEKATLLSENALPADSSFASGSSPQYVNLGAQLLGSS